MQDSIKENIKNVELKLDEAAKKSPYGNNPTLIAVSKTKPVSMLMEAYETGIRDFGENHVQEILEKYEVCPKDIRFHMIGHLQKNKVKYIVDKVFLIHSVDSLALALVIEKESVKKNVESNVLIEVNVAREESKFGIFKEDTLALIKEIAKLPHVHIKGLMTIAPYVTNPEDNRRYFEELKALSIDIGNQNIDNVCMDVLSMGMTGDYEVAASCGATYVRVGTGIFGERNYNK